MKTPCLTTAALLVGLAFAASAQEEGRHEARVGFGPQVGFYKTRDADGVRIMPGAALRLKFSDALGLEGSVNYREEKFRNDQITVRTWPIMVTGLLYPIPQMYGAIGAGWYNTSVDFNFPSPALGGPVPASLDSKSSFGWHFGAGLELPVGDVGALVGDIRYVFLDYDFKNLPGSGGVNANFYVITAGLLFGL
jgi:opacity protein-like surface antigen